MASLRVDARGGTAPPPRLLICGLIAAAILITACGRQIIVRVDSDAVPGWIFIQLRQDCRAAGSVDNAVLYDVDRRGYACTSTPLPDRFRERVVIVNRRTGKETVAFYDGPSYFVAECRDKRKLEFIRLLVWREGGNPRPPVYDSWAKLGLDCPPPE